VEKDTITGRNIFKFSNQICRENLFHFNDLKNFLRSNSQSVELIIKVRTLKIKKYIQVNISRIITFGRTSFVLLCYDVTANYRKYLAISQKYFQTNTQIKEIHHRIKNNLQLIASILNLEYKRHIPEGDGAISQIIKASQNKIFSISLIHQNLYETEHLNAVNPDTYIKQLFKYISNLYSDTENKISLHIVDHWKSIPIKESIYIGLIIDEIITNAFKHAFSNKKSGEINILLTKTDNCATLDIRDNGAGFNNSESEQSKSFGMELIHTLVKQIKGKIEINSEVGTNYKIKIPDFFA
jgi:two-component sensor histidine kinase